MFLNKFKVLVIIIILSSYNIEARKIPYKWDKYFGVQFGCGYPQYIQKKHIKPFKALEYIKIKDISYTISITYQYSLSKYFILKPYLGYGNYIENSWPNGNNSPKVQYLMETLYIGSFFEYEINKFHPKVGVCAKRILARTYKEISPQPNTHRIDLDTKNFIQVQIGLDYVIKNYSLGLSFNRGITFVSPTTYYAPSFAINEYMITFSWNPFLGTDLNCK